MVLRKITKAGNLAICITAITLAIAFTLYGFFTLWDMYRTEIKAFASYDLLQYRPDIEHDEPPYLDELIKINPDTAGWVTIYGTNIDYPVMQGKTDMEYINKTALGGYAATGSIFLSVLNKKDFSDPYNIIYGHHMNNGAMFGDIDKFKEKSFFENRNNIRYKKEEGVLIQTEEVWNLKVFALLKTDAYDYRVYRPDKDQSEIPEMVEYLKENAEYYRDVREIDKILAMSTCNDGNTNGRTVLFCKLEKRTEPLPTREKEPLTPHRKAVGHPMSGAYWSFLNLFVLVLTLISAFPVHIYIRRKCRSEQKKTWQITVFASAAASFVLFWITEDMHRPIQLVDMWTPLMILILVFTWFMQCRFWGMKITQRRKNIVKEVSND